MDISAYQHMSIRMSNRGKRPLRNLTPGDKVRAIQRIHNGETKASVSRDIGVPESTLRGWCKNEQKLRFMCHQLGEQIGAGPTGAGSENPPEKRAKYEPTTLNTPTPKFANLPNSYEDFAGLNRLPLAGMDLLNANNAANANSTTNAILEKLAFNDFMKKTQQHAAEAGKLNFPNHAANAGTGPDFSQLSVMQNLNLLSLFNPNLSSESAAALALQGAAGMGLNENLNKMNNNNNKPLRVSNSTSSSPSSSASSVSSVSFEDSNKSNGELSVNSLLSVKNWAKDPSEENKSKRNDKNNNDIKSKLNSGNGLFPEGSPFPALFPGGFPQMPQPNGDTESSNAALLEWCKVFNASLNFLALAAAAAALQPQQGNNGNNNNNNLPLTPLSLENNNLLQENILYKQLTLKTEPRQFLSPTTSNHSNGGGNFHMINSDVSNDSYFDSEPEDLSVRSAASKMSSSGSPNSRSQSPMKINSVYAPNDDYEKE